MFSKRLAICVLLTLVGTIACAGSKTVPAAAKIEMLGQLEKSFAALEKLATECVHGMCNSDGEVDQTMIDERVRAILADVKDCDLLFRIAVLSYLSAYPQTAGLQSVDVVFDTSWNHVLRLLGSLRTPESLAALRSINHVLRTQGGERLALESLIDQTEKSVGKPNR
jgi:hypothetical protein